MQEKIKYFDLSKLDHLDICHGFSLYKGIVIFWFVDEVDQNILKLIDSIPSHIVKNLGAVHVAWNIYTFEIVGIPQEFRDYHEKDIQNLKNHLTKRQAKEIDVDKHKLYGIRLLWHEEPESWTYKTGKVIKFDDALFHIFDSGQGEEEQTSSNGLNKINSDSVHRVQ